MAILKRRRMWGIERKRAAVANAGKHVIFAKARRSAMIGECYVDRQQVLDCVLEASFPHMGW